MRKCYRGVTAFLAVCLLVFAATGASAQCVSGTVTAEFQTSGPFAGLWKYTIDFSWDTAQGLSNVTLDCGFGDCVDEACTATWMFDDPAGYGPGDGCTLDFDGEFNCQGNPSIGFTDPVLKWDAVGECQPEAMGSATLCAYTNIGPHPDSQLPIILIKNGQNVCNGTIMGDCPSPCTVPTESANWGFIKAQYKMEFPEDLE